MNDLENDDIDNQLDDSDENDDELESRKKKAQVNKTKKKVSSGLEVVRKETTLTNDNASNEPAKKRKITQTPGESIPSQESQNFGKKRKTAQGNLSEDFTFQTKTVQNLHGSESESSTSVDFVPSETQETLHCNSTSSRHHIEFADKVVFPNDSSSDVESVTSSLSLETMNKDKGSSQLSHDCVSSVIRNTPSENDSLANERHHQKEMPGSNCSDTMHSDTANQSSLVKNLSLSQVFTLKTLAPVTCKFTSPNKLSSSQTLCPYLHYSVEPWGNEDGFNTTPGKVPVALVSNTSLSRASRTSLFIARGKQEVKRTSQMLTKRAFNTHDVVSINNCHLKLMLKSRVGQAIKPIEISSYQELSESQVSGGL